MTNCNNEETTATLSAMRSAFRESSTCRPLRMYHACTLITRKAPARNAPIHTWVSLSTLLGLKTMAQKSVISARASMPSPTTW